MALVAGITGQELQARAITTLRAAGTLAGPRVFEQRDWPTSAAIMPAILVKVMGERSVSHGRNGPYCFNTTFVLVVICRQVGITPEPVGADLLIMAEQVKSALLGTYEFNKDVQQFASIQVENVVASDGKLHTGEAGMHLEIEVFQEYGPNDGTPLVEIQGTLTNPASGVSYDAFKVAFPG